MGPNLTNAVVSVGILLLAIDVGSGVSGFSTTNRKPPKVSTPSSLRVATIDAGELFDGSFFPNEGFTESNCVDASVYHVKNANTTSHAWGRAVERISSSGLAWAAIGAFVSLSTALNTQALGTSLRILNSFFSWYMTRLELAPLVTKSITGGIVAMIGDYGAQWFEYKSSRPSGLPADPALSLRAGGYASARQPGRLSIRGTYDARRGVARFLECLLVSSPLMHYGYDFFESILPVVGSIAALAHVLLDCVFLDSIFVGTSILATSVMEGHSLRKHVLPNLRSVYFPTMKASVMTSSALIPLQFLSFRFLPLQLRVLSVNAVDLIWTGVVSFVSHGGDFEGRPAHA